MALAAGGGLERYRTARGPLKVGGFIAFADD